MTYDGNEIGKIPRKSKNIDTVSVYNTDHPTDRHTDTTTKAASNRKRNINSLYTPASNGDQIPTINSNGNKDHKNHWQGKGCYTKKPKRAPTLLEYTRVAKSFYGKRNVKSVQKRVDDISSSKRTFPTDGNKKKVVGKSARALHSDPRAKMSESEAIYQTKRMGFKGNKLRILDSNKNTQGDRSFALNSNMDICDSGRNILPPNLNVTLAKPAKITKHSSLKINLSNIHNASISTNESLNGSASQKDNVVATKLERVRQSTNQSTTSNNILSKDDKATATKAQLTSTQKERNSSNISKESNISKDFLDKLSGVYNRKCNGARKNNLHESNVQMQLQNSTKSTRTSSIENTLSNSSNLSSKLDQIDESRSATCYVNGEENLKHSAKYSEQLTPHQITIQLIGNSSRATNKTQNEEKLETNNLKSHQQFQFTKETSRSSTISNEYKTNDMSNNCDDMQYSCSNQKGVSDLQDDKTKQPKSNSNESLVLESDSDSNPRSDDDTFVHESISVSDSNSSSDVDKLQDIESHSSSSELDFSFVSGAENKESLSKSDHVVTSVEKNVMRAKTVTMKRASNSIFGIKRPSENNFSNQSGSKVTTVTRQRKIAGKKSSGYINPTVSTERPIVQEEINYIDINDENVNNVNNNVLRASIPPNDNFSQTERSNLPIEILDQPRVKRVNISGDERNWLELKLNANAKEYLKSANLFSVDKLLSISAVKLSKMYEVWRGEQKFKPIPSILSLVAKWQALAYLYKSENIDGCSSSDIETRKPRYQKPLEEIKHLTTIAMVKDLPRKYITVINDNDTLFDFRVNIDQSKIPNSGYGAFLTYLGARTLKPNAQRLRDELMEDRIELESNTRDPLFAFFDGMDVLVTLNGADLHGNGNCSHYSLTNFPLEATLPNKKNVSVRFVPNRLHESIQDLRDNNEIPFPKNGIGKFKMFTQSDYESDPSIDFSSERLGAIALGRYGPFDRNDKKTLEEFQIKDFLFDSEPAAWNFGVDEKLRGSIQIVDITDDCTGEPHRLAETNIPMYVNEVGHNKNLVQNVGSWDVYDREVHYHFYQRESMCKGETVELLVDYGKEYEDSRVRKGYGLENIENHVLCDEVESAKVKRDHADRVGIIVLIQSMTFLEIKNTLDFLETRIITPLVLYTDGYFYNIAAKSIGKQNVVYQVKPPSKKQLTARYRLAWIGQLYRERIKQMLANKQLDKIAAKKYLQILDPNYLDPHSRLVGSNNNLKEIKEVQDICFREEYEEFLLFISKEYGVFHAYDPSLWCDLGRTLCKKLIMTLLDLRRNSNGSEKRRNQQMFAAAIYDIAMNAVASVRSHVKILHSNSSKQQVLDSIRHLGFLWTENEAINNHLASASPSNADGDVVQLFNTGISPTISNHSLTLHNALETMCVSFNPGKFGKSKKKNMTLQLRCKSSSANKCNDNYDCLTLLKNGDIKVDEEWYILYQVIRIVDVISSSFIEWPSNCNILKTVCERTGVNFRNATITAAHRIELGESERNNEENNAVNRLTSHFTSKNDKLHINSRSSYYALNKGTPPKTEADNPVVDKQREIDQNLIRPYQLKVSKRVLYEKSDGSLPDGWRVDYVQRQSSNHIDRYWYTKTGKKLRSRVEVGLFLDLIKQSGGDEEAAWNKFPGSRKKMSFQS